MILLHITFNSSFHLFEMFTGFQFILKYWTCTDMRFVLLNQQHMIADTVRMIRHCQSEQPGERHGRDLINANGPGIMLTM